MSGTAPTAREEHADDLVLAALLREVDRDSAMREASAQTEPSNPAEDGTHTVRGRTVADARAKAQAQYGAVDVLDGYQTYSLFGRKQVVLTVRPKPKDSAPPMSSPPPARFTHEDVLWNRATLRGLGVPRSLLGRLPLDDPSTQEEWEEILTGLIAHELSAPAPYAESGTVSGVGARGAAAILVGMESGIPPGTLELHGVPFPATAPILVLALRSGMPLRVPPPVEHPISIPSLPAAPEHSPEHAARAFHTPEDHTPEDRTPEESEAPDNSGDFHDDRDSTPSDSDTAAGDLDAANAPADLEASPESETSTPAEASDTPDTPEETAAEPEEKSTDTQANLEAAPASPAAVLPPPVLPRVSGEVNGKLPRSVARRSVPGGHKTPYPTDGVDL